ncbi:ankyrin repeat-containing protein BDA1-like [Corylus avellana]|uniref:ankyrin repeat-containing protein BDA1-like n=1 Tax=Corylus avellana TaxID=13451 RepID=UPI00286B0348|nr:ankyrin repeat-containing protein BDA1-like [Corylus avellana]
MPSSLRDAAQQGSVDALYALIQRDAKVLDRIDEISFVDTPLHDAAYAGHTRFALEITQLLHRLLDFDDHLVRVQGREGVTPLHYVAQTGDLYLLAEFQNVCPIPIKNVTIRGETALHIALNNNQLDAFHLLVRWLQQTTFEDAALWAKKLLNWKDEEGKTVLHIATMKTLPRVVRWLLDARVDTNATNLAGFTALDILQGKTQIDNNKIRDMLTSSLPRNIDIVVDLREAAQLGSVDSLYTCID